MGLLFSPTLVCRTVLDITPKILAKMSVNGLLLDVDNTLTTHNNAEPAPGVVQWLKMITDSGVKAAIISNNSAERVGLFARRLGLDYIPNAAKPLVVGIRRGEEKLGIPREKLAIVGDQIYTDMLGGALAGIKTIYVFPLQPEKGMLFKLKRFLEYPFIPPPPSSHS